jgi:hypothetical protein
MHQLRLLVFRLFERRLLRDWFYTIAFIIFVPVGLRFATLAWRYGSWEDKPLSVIAGMFIGVTAMVTLLRFWHVPPQQVVTADGPAAVVAEEPVHRHAEEYIEAVRYRAAANRAIAHEAGALGSTLRRRARW